VKDEEEIRVTSTGSVSGYVSRACKLFTELEKTYVLIAATGNALTKAVTSAEIVKRRFKGLHQITKIGSREIIDEYEPLEEGLENVSETRNLPFIEIRLSKEPLDTTAMGYQPPIDESEVKEYDPEAAKMQENEESRGKGKGRSKGKREDDEEKGGKGKGKKGRSDWSERRSDWSEAAPRKGKGKDKGKGWWEDEWAPKGKGKDKGKSKDGGKGKKGWDFDSGKGKSKGWDDWYGYDNYGSKGKSWGKGKDKGKDKGQDKGKGKGKDNYW
jgi:DNA-binding protein